jgi:tetratricopeptide (TPR) repeat protein
MTAADRHIAAISGARAAIRQGNLELAGSVAAEVLSEAPRNIDALEIKALAAAQRGAYTVAEETLREAIAIAPERRWPYADLGRLLLKLGRTADAEQVARAALEADPANADAHAMLGSICAEHDRWFEAAEHFDHAVALAGPHPQLLTGFGQALLRLGLLDEARGKLEAALAADAEALEPLAYLAELQERLGCFDEAARLLDRAEAMARRRGTDVDLQRSVLLARMGEHDRALALLEANSDLSGAAMLQRGRLRERVGRYAEAWNDWTQGKAKIAERTGRHYLAADVAAEAERLAGAFGSPVEAALRRAERRSGVPQPIFIIGLPRSGTTLVEQILTSHSAIRAGGELPFGAELHELGDVDSGEKLRDFYLARADSYGLLASGVDYFTDKMPDNTFWLPLLRIAFPDSAVILVRRHPLDVLTSVMAHDMTHGFNCAYRIEDAARHFALIDQLIERFSESGLGPTFELRYESLVEDQLGETKRLMAAIGLEMEPAQLRFHQQASVPATPSYAQVQEPLNDHSIGRWRNFAKQLERVRPIVADAMARRDYAA